MRIVVKIGTSSVTSSAGVIDDHAIAKLSDEIATLRTEGHEVLVAEPAHPELDRAAGVDLGRLERGRDPVRLPADREPGVESTA